MAPPRAFANPYAALPVEPSAFDDRPSSASASSSRPLVKEEPASSLCMPKLVVKQEPELVSKVAEDDPYTPDEE